MMLRGGGASGFAAHPRGGGASGLAARPRGGGAATQLDTAASAAGSISSKQQQQQQQQQQHSKARSSSATSCIQAQELQWMSYTCQASPTILGCGHR